MTKYPRLRVVLFTRRQSFWIASSIRKQHTELRHTSSRYSLLVAYCVLYSSREPCFASVNWIILTTNIVRDFSPPSRSIDQSNTPWASPARRWVGLSYRVFVSVWKFTMFLTTRTRQWRGTLTLSMVNKSKAIMRRTAWILLGRCIIIIIQLFSIIAFSSWTACRLSHGVFHSRLKTFLSPNFFPP